MILRATLGEYKMYEQLEMFDFIDYGENKEDVNPWEIFAKRGTGFVNGKQRVHEYFTKEKGKSARADFLKHEYGIGGFAEPRGDKSKFHLCDGYSDSRKLKIVYFLPNSDEEIEETCTYNELATVIDELIKKNDYM